jgi:hypothetical protein
VEFDGEGKDEAVDEEIENLIERADQALYQAKGQVNTHVERRRFKRRQIEPIPVTISHDGTKKTARLIDYSKGGIRVEGESDLRPGDTIEVQIEPPESREPVSASGTVRWSIEAGERDRNLMGVETKFPTDKIFGANND